MGNQRVASSLNQIVLDSFFWAGSGSLVVTASCFFCDTSSLYVLHFIPYVFLVIWVLNFETLSSA